MAEDREGEALEREIVADRHELRDRRRRRILFVPPLVALAVAAWALGESRPRAVTGARVWLAARPPAGSALSFRAEVVHAVPGFEDTWPAANVELRVARGRAARTDADGVAEISVDPPLPSEIDLEAKVGDSFRVVAHAKLSLVDPDPRNGAIELRRTGGAKTGPLEIDAWPEHSALSPPLPAAAWIRVRAAKTPVSGATVGIVGEAGVGADPPPTTTDAAGLARLPLTTTAPPVLITVKATSQGASGPQEGTWHGVLGAVQGVPLPAGNGLVTAGVVELLASPSWKTGYLEVYQRGVRLGGMRVSFAGGRALASLPAGASGVVDLLASSGTTLPSADDLLHAGTFPLVIAKDAVDAFGAVSTSPRFDEKIDKPPSSLATYDSVVAATLAAAHPAIPKVHLAANGLAEALRHEVARGTTVRRASSVAIVGGGLAELGLMIALGVVFQKRSIADELRDLDGENEAPTKTSSPWSTRVLAIVVTSLGIVALIFAALATMAWGLQ